MGDNPSFFAGYPCYLDANIYTLERSLFNYIYLWSNNRIPGTVGTVMFNGLRGKVLAAWAGSHSNSARVRVMGRLG